MTFITRKESNCHLRPDRLLFAAGIADEAATFTRSMMLNVGEEVQTVLQAAQYLDSDYVTGKILTIFGDGDKAEEMIRKMQTDELGRGGLNDNDNDNEEEDLE